MVVEFCHYFSLCRCEVLSFWVYLIFVTVSNHLEVKGYICLIFFFFSSSDWSIWRSGPHLAGQGSNYTNLVRFTGYHTDMVVV